MQFGTLLQQFRRKNARKSELYRYKSSEIVVKSEICKEIGTVFIVIFKVIRHINYLII